MHFREILFYSQKLIMSYIEFFEIILLTGNVMLFLKALNIYLDLIKVYVTFCMIIIRI